MEIRQFFLIIVFLQCLLAEEVGQDDLSLPVGNLEEEVKVL